MLKDVFNATGSPIVDSNAIGITHDVLLESYHEEVRFWGGVGVFLGFHKYMINYYILPASQIGGSKLALIFDMTKYNPSGTPPRRQR